MRISVREVVYDSQVYSGDELQDQQGSSFVSFISPIQLGRGPGK